MKLNVKRHVVVQPLDKSIRLIPLTQGQNAIVNASRYEFLMQWNWYAVWNIYTRTYYAVRVVGDKAVFMHNAVMGKTGVLHDHRNKNTLDNRMENLRECTVSQNGANRDKQVRNTTGYKGVFKNHSKWIARITVMNKRFHLGNFSNKESAARAYDAAALVHFGEFARLNFPVDH